MYEPVHTHAGLPIIARMNTTATLMDGKAVAKRILERCAQRVQQIIARTSVIPCLATALVGDDPASITYTRLKRKRCESVCAGRSGL